MKKTALRRLAFMSALVILAALHHQFQPVVRPSEEPMHIGKEKSATCPCGSCA